MAGETAGNKKTAQRRGRTADALILLYTVSVLIRFVLPERPFLIPLVRIR